MIVVFSAPALAPQSQARAFSQKGRFCSSELISPQYEARRGVDEAAVGVLPVETVQTPTGTMTVANSRIGLYGAAVMACASSSPAAAYVLGDKNG